jgi:ATP-dependent Clp protease ATP-binding subunit ClpC
MGKMSLKLSRRMKEIISYSRDEAERLGNDYIGMEHLLLGLIREDDNTAVRLLKGFNVEVQEMRIEIEQSIKSDKEPQRTLPLNAGAEQTIHAAVTEAKTSHSKKVEPEHLILAILNNSGTAPLILKHIRHNS